MQKVTTAQGQALADGYKIKFFETSAKANTNVDEAFESIAKDIVTRLKLHPDQYAAETNVRINKEEKKEEKSSGCC